ncbi:MAG: L,D-transpeptidase family protein, partial [Alphaproteobacteria bacterium]
MTFAGISVVVAGALALSGSAWAAGDRSGNPAESYKSLAWPSGALAEGPVQLIISVPEQRISVYLGGKLVAVSPVSTGQKGYATPTGVFSILQKKKFHRSNIYSRAPMPFMQRLTWSGIALHASNQVPDYPASHGCVRLPPDFAKKLFGFTQLGAHVIVSGDSKTEPFEISHPNLFQPLQPPMLSMNAAGATIEASLRRSITARDAPPD